MASGDIYTLFEMNKDCTNLFKRYGNTGPEIFCSAVSAMLDMYFKENNIPVETGWKILTDIASYVHNEQDMSD